MKEIGFKGYLLFFCLVVMAGMWSCATPGYYKMGLTAYEEKNYEEAIELLSMAQKQQPNNRQLELDLKRAESALADIIANQGWKEFNEENFEKAGEYFEQALLRDYTNASAQTGMNRIQSRQNADRYVQLAKKAIDDDNKQKARKLLHTALAEYPNHKSARKILNEISKNENRDSEHDVLNELVTFRFQDTSLKEIVRSISRAAEINILLDDSLVLPESASIEMFEIPLGKALESIASTYGLMLVPIQTNTYLIVLDDKQNRERYTPESVKMFILKYADAVQVKDVIDPIIKDSVILADERLNAVLIRTDNNQMNMVSELIHSMDMRESEVLIQLEVLEIKRSDLKELGASFGDDAKVTGYLKSDENNESVPGVISLNSIRNLSQNEVFFTLPTLYLNLLKKDSDTRLLAQPRLRILNRTSARLHIGEKIPVKVTTSRFRDTAEETSVYEYKDVGILMELLPKIVSATELALELKLEVSSIVKENEDGQPTIGTREISTHLRLKDGETEMIAGLIKNEERGTVTKIPLLGEIPLVGKFFSNRTSDEDQTDIIVALTPRMINTAPDEAIDDLIWEGMPLNTGSQSISAIPMKKNDIEEAYGSDRKIPQPPLPYDSGISSEDDDSQSLGEDIENIALTVKIVPEKLEISPGQTETIEINIELAANVGSVPFHILFNPDILELSDPVEGTFLNADGTATSFMTSIDNDKGRMIIGLTRLGNRQGADGSGNLMVFDVTGRSDGESDLKFDSAAVLDPLAGKLRARFQNGKVRVNSN